MKFSYKVFRTGDDVLLAIADSAIIGKTYSEGELQLEVDKEFYSENDCSESEVSELIKGATVINAVGNGIISVLIKNKTLDEGHILYIKGMPHAQIITLR